MVVNEPARFRLRTTRSGRRGLGPFALPQDERAEEDAGEDQGHDDVGAAPPAGAGFAEPVDEGHQSAAPEDDAEHVQPDARDARTRGDQPEGAEEDQPRDGQVHVEAPAPVDVLGQEAAEDEPEGGSGDGDGGVNPEGTPPLLRVGEGRGEDRQHRRRQQRAEEALQPAGADQHERGLRRPPRRPTPGRSRPRRSSACASARTCR